MFKKLGSHCVKVSEVYDTKDKAVFQAIGDGIRRYNMASGAHQVYWCISNDMYCIAGNFGGRKF